MSLTTHPPGQPCVGHCGACGAFSDWSEIITKLTNALEHIKLYPCPVCMEESPKELCPYHIVIKEFRDAVD